VECEIFDLRRWDALYQGTTLAGPLKSHRDPGFSPWFFLLPDKT
jgi:hypothetical protein